MLTLQGLTWDHLRDYAPLVACCASSRQRTVNVAWTKQSPLDFALAPVEKFTQQYDLVILDHPHIGQAARANCLLPLDEHLDPGVLDGLADGSVGPSHDSYCYDGHQWALAVDAACHSSSSRSDLLESPLPHTWQAVLALGKDLNTSQQFLGMTLVQVSAMCSFLTLCAAHRSPLGGVGFVDPEVGHWALETLQQLAALAHPRSFEWNTVQLLDHMSTAGDTPYCPLVFCYSSYARTGFAPNRLRFTGIPGSAGAAGWRGIAITRQSQNVVSR
jgi:multiple sugar transport system substrate-binding protein